MKKLMLMSVLTACLAGTAQADLVSFTFDSLATGGRAAIETYLEGRAALAGITVDVTITEPSLGAVQITQDAPLGSDSWVQSQGGGGASLPPPGVPDSVVFTFSVPITSVSFDWAKQKNGFYAEAGNDQTVVVFFSDTTPPAHGDGATSGHENTFTFGSPATKLAFHDSGDGWVGVDNLIVDFVPVPVPAAVLMGLLGLGAAGLKLRKFA